MSDIGNRLTKFASHLNISIRAFEMKSGLSNGLIGKVISKNGSLGIDKVSKILYSFPELNVEWLLTGKGEMIQPFQLRGNQRLIKTEPGAHGVVEGIEDYSLGIPYYDILPASAGNLTAFLDQAKPTSYINLPQLKDCIAILPVYGSSMKGVVEPGDLIAIKEILTRNEFDPAMPYLVITEEHRMVKYLHVDEKDDNVIWAESTNHSKIRLAADSIKKVYAIKCVIRLY
jgi:phage repressor protein C with HTH and peptisase S24 domain